MLKEHSRLVDACIRLLDALALFAALPAAVAVRNWLLQSADARFSLANDALLLAVTLLVWVAISWLFDVYDAYRVRPLSAELGRIARAVLVMWLVLAALSFLYKGGDLSRLAVALYAPISLLLIGGIRLALRLAARRARIEGYNTRYFTVVGSGEVAEDVVCSVASHPEWGYAFAGYILEDDAPAETCDLPVLGRLRDLGRLLEDRVLDEIFFAVPRHRLDRIEEAVRLCEEQGVAFRVCLQLFENTSSRMTLSDLAGMPTLSFSRTPGDELALAAKRAFDVAASGLALILLGPIFAALALLIRLDSTGPVFFRQKRVGLNGREFTLYKFRSMALDAEARLGELLQHNEMSGPVFKMAADPRVTRVGRFMRRTSLDELPQFWNVLRGEMSVVGPRPPIPAEVRSYQRWQRRRLSVKPGITCTWQISGRNTIDFDRWMELDLEYIDGWSLWGDIRICLKTIPAVIAARGAR
jgi:exopolysaccharide biosynthesis polyprenyl glycosylphosphotransferase